MHYCVIVAGSSPGKTKMWAAVRRNGIARPPCFSWASCYASISILNIVKGSLLPKLKGANVWPFNACGIVATGWVCHIWSLYRYCKENNDQSQLQWYLGQFLRAPAGPGRFLGLTNLFCSHPPKLPIPRIEPGAFIHRASHFADYPWPGFRHLVTVKHLIGNIFSFIHKLIPWCHVDDDYWWRIIWIRL